MNSIVASWAIAGGLAVLAVAVIGSILLHRRSNQLREESDAASRQPGSSPSETSTSPSSGAPSSSSATPSSSDAVPSIPEGEPGESDGTAPTTTDSSNEAADEEAEGDSSDPASGTATDQSDARGKFAGDGSVSTDSDDQEPADTPSEPAEDEVVQEASDALDAFDLESTIREMRREYWASRWLLGEEACDDLRQALGKARGIAASCLSDTTVQQDGTVSFPPGCSRMNSIIAATQEPAQPLRALRLTKFTHAITSCRAEPPADINPHRAAVHAGRYVSPDPTYGLHRLAAELEAGLSQARLEIAKVSPTAGSTISSRLRSGLADATTHLRKANERLAEVESPSQSDILEIERDLLRAAWWRRSIDLTEKYLNQRDWALTSEDAHEWTRLAVLASRLTNVLVDLHEDEVERTDLVKLAKAQVLIDQGSKQDRRDVPVRTARKVVETCDELMVNISKSADSK